MSKNICSVCKGEGFKEFLTRKESCCYCEGTGIDFDLTDEILCPYCGEKFIDSYEYVQNCFDGDEVDINCQCCDKPFKIIFNLSVSYTSIKGEIE